MKSFIFVFALIAAASCDVSHVVQGDGWFKDASGYHYTEPAVKFDAPVPEELFIAPEEPVIVVEESVEPISPADEPILVELDVAAPEEPIVEDDIVEVVDEYIPPSDYLPPNNNEYLPPKSEEAKKKRQVPVRKVYRRFIRRQ
ncbi:hypothetical protein ACKWTF_004694 [Chironomus riparius]